MPIYEYEHLADSCSRGRIFEVNQPISAPSLTRCPNCGNAVRKLISLANISTPRTNSELRDLGFTKLVRRDKGVYENVTAREGESRVVQGDRPDTYPNFRKTISD